MSVVIGWGNYFGFGFTTLRHSFEKSSIDTDENTRIFSSDENFVSREDTIFIFHV